MRITALILGLVSGFWGMMIGFFSYGYTVFVSWFGEVPDVAEQVADVQLIRFVSLIAPILALVGGGMSMSRPIIGGILMLASAAGMYHAFSFGVFTMFPITLCGVAGVLALIAGTTKAD